VTAEAAFIAALRSIATVPAARGLTDDVAVLDIGGARLVLTMDTIVSGVHFLPDDPPESVAWKLVATNVSDLAAKGATPRGCLLSYSLAPKADWDAAFLRGLEEACRHFMIPLLGGDTVRQLGAGGRSFALVAIGEPAPGVPVPSRSGARAGDLLWVSAPIGDAGLGLSILRDGRKAERVHRDWLVARYRTPMPAVALGAGLAPQVSAMMDVSDGVLIDVSRLAAASGVAAIVDLDRLPLSRAFGQTWGDGPSERLFAASAGDDYCLLFTAPADARATLEATATEHGGNIYCIGRIMGGRGLTVLSDGEPVTLPSRLGFEH
jgi:thiamine-monophosphate kinase